MTKYLKEEQLNKETILELADAIRGGKIIVLKTDTVYGICTNALNQKACQKIYDIKKRPLHKPLIVLISDMDMLKSLAFNYHIQEKRKQCTRYYNER